MKPRLLGVLVAFATMIADQANKLWLIDVFHIAERQPVQLTPFFDVVYTRNPGISYSLFSAHTEFGRWALLAGTIAATLLIAAWLWRASSKLVAFALGFIVGGALGNACDRLFYGAVSDFYYFHAGNFSWYVFNFADCAIVAGVALLLYDSIISDPKKTPLEGDECGDAQGQAATKSPRSEA